MCNDWLKEFKGWCKSFTRTEILLAILEAILLIICIGFLIFLILHFLVCSHKQHNIPSTNPYITTPVNSDEDDNYKPNSEKPTQKFVYIHKGDSYTAVVTIPYGTATEKIIFINKGVPAEVVVKLPYHVTSTKVSAEDDNRVSHEKDNDNKETTTEATAAPYEGVKHKKIYINKEITSGNVTGVGTSPLDGVSRKIIVINKETTSAGPRDYSLPTEEREKLQDGQSAHDGGLPQGNREPQYTSPILTTTDLECSWHPSKKTVAPTHYYFKNRVSTSAIFLKRKKTSKDAGKPVLKLDSEDDSVIDYVNMDTSQAHDASTETSLDDLGQEPEPAGLDALAYDDQSDGEESLPLYKSFVLALVKVKPSREVQFGCILTAVTAYWTLTAASCIESIEEVDSLDTFVMMEGYGEYDPGRTYAVSDVQVHPMYQGANRSHDLAALRSEERLRRVKEGARLPNLVDYYAITAAERFTILGFGSFR